MDCRGSADRIFGYLGRMAHAEPSSPAPGPTATSSDDELTDMVMDAIQQDAPAPSATPVVPPPP